MYIVNHDPLSPMQYKNEKYVCKYVRREECLYILFVQYDNFLKMTKNKLSWMPVLEAFRGNKLSRMAVLEAFREKKLSRMAALEAFRRTKLSRIFVNPRKFITLR